MKKLLKTESFKHRSWTSLTLPKKILIIRFHAFGDVVITLPYLQSLKNALPNVELHFLTRKECSDILRHISIFSKIYDVDDKRDAKLLFAKNVALLPLLMREHYDIVLDLQRNNVSRMIRRFLMPKSFSEFDRFSLKSAGERVQQTINALQLGTSEKNLPSIVLKEVFYKSDQWALNGYSEGVRYVVLNPAGSSITKNWPIENFERFAKLWNELVNSNTHFLIIGTDRIQQKAEYLSQRLGSKVINLVNATTTTEAFLFLQKAQFVLSEDSALMHMAWISQIPLVALFGSTPSVWSKPLGNTSLLLNSSDLECGNCNQPQCRFGDVHCLTRFTPEFVLEKALVLLQNQKSIRTKEQI